MRLNLKKWTFFVFYFQGAYSMTQQGCKIHLCSVTWLRGSWIPMPGNCSCPMVSKKDDTIRDCSKIKNKCNTTLVLTEVMQNFHNKTINFTSYHLFDCLSLKWAYQNLQRKFENGIATYNAGGLGDKCRDHPQMILCAEFSALTYQTTDSTTTYGIQKSTTTPSTLTTSTYHSKNSSTTYGIKKFTKKKSTLTDPHKSSSPNAALIAAVVLACCLLTGILPPLTIWLIRKRFLHRIIPESMFCRVPETAGDERGQIVLSSETAQGEHETSIIQEEHNGSVSTGCNGTRTEAFGNTDGHTNPTPPGYQCFQGSLTSY